MVGRGKARTMAGEERVMLPIPIGAAKQISDRYGYDQVVIYARRVGDGGGEHMTTYGVNKEHCNIASRMARTLQEFMGWAPKKVNVVESQDA